MTGLEKRIVDFPVVPAAGQKFASELFGEPQALTMQNVQLDKLGRIKRRSGFTALSSSTIDATSFSPTNVRKLAVRNEELVAISTDQSAFGSGGGAGNAGDLLFSYSEEAAAWKAHAKMPRPTLDRFVTIPDESGVSWEHSCCVITLNQIDVLVCVYYVNASATGTWTSPGIRVVAYDLTTRSIMLDDQLVATNIQPTVGLRVVAIGHQAFVCYADTNDLEVFKVSLSSSGVISISTPQALLEPAGVGIYQFYDLDVATDGTYLYVADVHSRSAPSGRDLTIIRYSTTLVSAGIKTIDVTSELCTKVAIASGGNGYLYGAFSDTAANAVCVFSQATASNMAAATQLLHTVIQTSDLLTPVEEVGICAFGSGQAMVFGFARGATSSGEPGSSDPPVLCYRDVASMTGTPAVSSAATRKSPCVVPMGRPFTYAGRMFILVAGYDYDGLYNGNAATPCDDFGFVLCEVDTATTVGTYTKLMPVAWWSRDIAFLGDPGLGEPPAGRTGFLHGQYWYATTGRLTQSVQQGAYARAGSTAIDVMKLDFADAKRWQEVDTPAGLFFTGACPYIYDGENAHECGFAFRPRILGYASDLTSGNLSTNVLYTWRVCYEFVDTYGNRWFSDMNYADELSLQSNVAWNLPRIHVRPPALTSMTNGGFHFSGQILVNLYREKATEPGDWVKVDTKVVDPLAVDYVVLTDNTADVHATKNERAYIWGGELDNFPAPPLRDAEMHQGRLWGIAADDEYAYYSKPFQRGRGIEWSRAQRIPLHQRGMAVASLESGVVIFLRHSIYAVHGHGPGATGQPVDGFSRLQLVSASIGCSEVAAAWSTPAGIVFRSDQGFWILDRAFNLKYIGAEVEDFIRDVSETKSAVVDVSLGCVRWLVTDSAGLPYRLNYWYDTNRWSWDTAYDTAETQVEYSATYYDGSTVIAAGSGGILKSSSDAFSDSATHYEMRVRYGWFRVAPYSQMKRLWRVYAHVTAPATLATNPLEVQVYADGKLTSPDTRNRGIFTRGEVEAAGRTGEVKTVRKHVVTQKVKSWAVEIRDRAPEYADANEGYTIYGMSFEVGTKRGAQKTNTGATE